MSLNIKALTVAGTVLIGGCVLVVGILNLIFPSYGVAFLELGAAVYPGYQGPSGFGSVIVVTLYALLEGAVGGVILAWVYNAVAGGGKSAAA